VATTRFLPQRYLTLAEADKRFNEARFARILFLSLAAFCEAAPRVKYDLHLPLIFSSVVRVTSSCCSAFCSRSYLR
jgi:hypothetical protein